MSGANDQEGALAVLEQKQKFIAEKEKDLVEKQR